MPPHSLCFDFPFFCRSNWLTEVDCSNRKTTFHRLSTFSVASIRALVRPRASLYRFSALSALSALQCGNPIHVVIMPVRSWPPRNKMLAKYPFAVKLTSFDSVSPRLIAFIFLFFSPLCSQFFLKFSLLRIPLKVFDKIQSVYLSHFYFHSTQLRKEPI